MSQESIFTRVIRAGRQLPPSAARPAALPIVPSVGFVHQNMTATDAALGGADFVYGRNASPNPAALELTLAELEQAEAAAVFSTGMAALHAAILASTLPGGTIVAARQLYGVTRTLLDWMAYSMGYSVHYADFLDRAAAQNAITRHQPQLVISEVITNPLGRVVRLDHIVTAAQSQNALTLVDNTFATPYLLRPLQLDADIVVHSTTKFLNGHGDVMGGVVAANAELIEGVREYRKLLGASMGPFEAWLTLRGLRTFPLRMQQAVRNARAVAQFLAEQPQIARVFYAGLPTDPSHKAAEALLSGPGATLAFQLKGAEREETFAFVERLRLIQPITSLGDIYSEVSHPATSSHRALDPAQRRELGITEGILRLSMGIEAPEDLIADLAQALSF